MSVFSIIGKAPTIDAIVQTGPRKLEFARFARPAVGRGDAILRVEACGMCGSDIEQYSGLQSYARFPYIPGHEPVGIIDEIGEDAARRWGVKVGDRVAVEPVITCGHCEHCHTGRRLLCDEVSILGQTSTDIEPSVLGAYAQYMYLPQGTVVHKLSSNLSPAAAVLFNPLGAGIRWAVTESSLKMGDTIVILGCGQRGIAAVIAAKAAGAARIIVTDIEQSARKLEVALSIGADHAIVADKQDVVEEVLRLTGGKLADVVLDVTSALRPLTDALLLVRKGGTVVIGGIKGRENAIQLYSDELVLRSITLKGVFTVDTRAYRQALNMIAAGTAHQGAFETQIFSLQRTEEAIHRLAGWDGKDPAIHVMVDPWA